MKRDNTFLVRWTALTSPDQPLLPAPIGSLDRPLILPDAMKQWEAWGRSPSGFSNESIRRAARSTSCSDRRELRLEEEEDLVWPRAYPRDSQALKVGRRPDHEEARPRALHGGGDLLRQRAMADAQG